ncbi:hypothetical protein EPUS_00597 [Endocarpon pusillum Z07020]|uniref:Tc1-like transposase DDE domain-containing protein n=1 Tax=Endocarpon pusillum (strain Z07020 / HMAS-L-300199) TaxID=1263415 RepID=U1GHL4_ENDPU|nr:uncharacterized protein EPUS_00597 [Endocarpon pusillum Z07020]ERF71608.1 hypothetical protein EPUS_00597 [Endocarpon pusillum Z07020]
MKDFGVGTYMAVQKKCSYKHIFEQIVASDWDKNCVLIEDNDGPHGTKGKGFNKVRVHRRKGYEARNALSKTQFKLKRQNQSIHVYRVIGWNFKGQLYFYTGSGIGGRLVQADYMVILEQIVAPDWDKSCVLIEDNDGPHGTKGKGFNKVKALKDHLGIQYHLGIQWESNPPNSPDLNPIETIWRIIKQRLKSRGVIFEEAILRRAIQEEWDKITIEEINRAISTMPDRVAALNERNGRPIPY